MASFTLSVSHTKLCAMTKQQAIDHFGSGAALARALGITRGSVTNWGEKIPLVRQCQIEVVTGGKLRADDWQKRQPPGAEAA
jgi:biotin operon repressor